MKDQNSLNKPLKKIVTHSGNFHTDEVFACAVLSLLHDGAVEIVRSRESAVWAMGDYVMDVGGVYDAGAGRFDHHQEGGAGVRDNGTPYSSFGLVWKEFGERITGSAYAVVMIDKRLVQPIDAGDNGFETFGVRGDVAPYILQDAIASFRPTWNEARTEDEGFFEAFEVAKKILAREVVRTQSEENGKRHAEEAYEKAEDKRIIILEDHYPWYEALGTKPEPLYVVKPDRGNLGKWKIEAVRDEAHTFKNRKDFPRTWAGKTDTELAQISGVSDALFCHNKLFVAVAGSKDGALALARIAVENNN